MAGHKQFITIDFFSMTSDDKKKKLGLLFFDLKNLIFSFLLLENIFKIQFKP
jgi:hypothetical protein